MYAIGQANVNGDAWVASQLATLEIAEPFVQFAMDRSAAEQGKPTEIFCKITTTKPFEGNAKVKLLGLPNKVAAPEMEFNKDTKELVFKITTDPASPPGRHKNVFAQVVIPQNGERSCMPAWGRRNCGSTSHCLRPRRLRNPKAETANRREKRGTQERGAASA